METEREHLETKRGAHNEIEYRNVDEEGEHDERGSQGPGPERQREDTADADRD